MKGKTKKGLLLEVEDLRIRLQEAEEILSAIRRGEVDGLVVSSPEGDKVYTLRGASQVYRAFVESMSEGALSLTEEGAIFYSNARFSRMVESPLEKLVGMPLKNLVAQADLPFFESISVRGMKSGARGELRLVNSRGALLPVQLSISPLKVKGDRIVACAIITDLTEYKLKKKVFDEEKLSRSILDQASEAIVVCDAQGTITRASRAAHELCGGDPLLKPFEDMFELRYSAAGRDFRVSGPLHGEVVGGVEVVLNRDEKAIHLLLNAGPLLSEKEEFIGCIIILTDITDLKEIERSLLKQASELEQARMQAENEKRQMQTVMEALPIGVAITDVSGGLVQANRVYEDVWGNPRPEVRSVNGYVAYKAWWVDTGRAVSPEEWASAVAVKKGKAAKGQLLEIERFDGSRAFVINSASPVRDSNGEVVGSAVVIQDITDLHKAQEALRRSESRFKLLSETAGRLLESPDPQGIVNSLCREVMEHLDCHVFFNFLADEEAGRLRLNAFAGIPEEEAKTIEWLDYGVAVCGCVARDGERIIAEDIFNTPDIRTELVKSYGIQAYCCHPLRVREGLIGTLSFGTKTRPRFLHEEVSLMRTVADQVAAAMERMRLIDELRKSRDELENRIHMRTAELEKKNQELQEFAFVASHDLQEPLRKIQTFGELLTKKSAASLGPEALDYVERMRRAAARMKTLLESLLAYSRVTTKVTPFVQTDLGRSVQGALSNLEVVVREKNAVVKVDSLPTIDADRSQMIQLFQNLIANALKFQRENETPRVSIYARKKGTKGTHEICIEDNGIGFDEKYVDKIFIPFQRLHGRSDYEGVGMGLAISKKIVERHGGGITARSELGKGSTFVVTFPAKRRRR